MGELDWQIVAAAIMFIVGAGSFFFRFHGFKRGYDSDSQKIHAWRERMEGSIEHLKKDHQAVWSKLDDITNKVDQLIKDVAVIKTEIQHIKDKDERV